MSSKDQLTRPVKEGWLFKEGGAARTKWQSRWFVLRKETLYYYSKKDEQNALGSINLMETDDITKIGEHSGKANCLTIVGSKGGSKKVYYLAADSAEALEEWFVAVKAASFADINTRFTRFVTVDVYLTEGIRVSGDVCYQILSSLSSRLSPEKKKRDHLGWFCERQVPLTSVLNLFVTYGWTPEKIYRSSASSPVDSGVHPVIRVIFTKPPDFIMGKNPAITRKGFGESIRGHFNRGRIFENNDSGGVNAAPEQHTIDTLGPDLLEGSDNELIALMQEFDIPLSLLQIEN